MPLPEMNLWEQEQEEEQADVNAFPDVDLWKQQGQEAPLQTDGAMPDVDLWAQGGEQELAVQSLNGQATTTPQPTGRGLTFDSPDESSDFLGLDRMADIPRATLEVGTHVVGGALAWLPSKIAKHTNVEMNKLHQALAKDMQEMYASGEMENLTPEVKANLERLATMSPEEMQSRGSKVEEFVGTLGGLLPEVRTEAGEYVLHNVERVIHAVTAPVNWLGEVAMMKLEYGDLTIPEIMAIKHTGKDTELPVKNPNLRDLVQTFGELLTFHGIGKMGVKGKDKLLETKAKVKEYLEAGKPTEAQGALNDFFASEDVGIKSTLEPGPKATAQEKQNYINRLYREEIIEGELDITPYGVTTLEPYTPKRRLDKGQGQEIVEGVPPLEVSKPGARAAAETKQAYIDRVFREEKLEETPYGVTTTQPEIPSQVLPKRQGQEVTPTTPSLEVSRPGEYASPEARQTYMDRVFREENLAEVPYGVSDPAAIRPGKPEPAAAPKLRLIKPRNEPAKGLEFDSLNRNKELINTNRKHLIEQQKELDRNAAIKKQAVTDELFIRARQEGKRFVRPPEPEVTVSSPITLPPEGTMSVTGRTAAEQFKQYRIDQMKRSDPVKAELQKLEFEKQPREEHMEAELRDSEIPAELREQVTKDEIFEEYLEDPYNDFEMNHGLVDGEVGGGFGESMLDALFDPLRNEQGAIEIANIVNSMRRKKSKKAAIAKVRSIKDLSPQELKKLKDMEVLAKFEGKTVRQKLEEGEMSEAGIKLFEQLIRETKPKRQIKKESYEKSKIKDLKDADVTKPIPGEAIVNTNPNFKVSKSWFDAIETVKHVTTPDWIKTILTGDTMFRAIPKEFTHLKYHVWALETIIKKEVKTLMAEAQKIIKQFPSLKGREAAGTRLMAKNKNGLQALATMGKKISKEYPEYDQLTNLLEPKLEEIYKKVNEVRELTGQPKLRELDSYMPFYTQHRWIDFARDSASFIKHGTTGRDLQKYRQKEKALANDTNAAIAYRHSPEAIEAMNFRHTKRTGVGKGTRLHLDPIQTYVKYANEAITYTNMSPVVGFVKELSTGKFKDPKTGKTVSLKGTEVGDSLGVWSNNLAGVPNWIVPKWIERGSRKLSGNLTAATLLYNIRTLAVQFTALHATTTEFGYTPTLKGINGLIQNDASVPIHKSHKLFAREFEASMRDTHAQLSGRIVKRSMNAVKNKGKEMLAFTDGIAAEITWRAAYDSVAGKIKSKEITERDGIRYADEAVVRTQASGSPSDISPIQMSALGRAATLWQTYTIGHINWIAKDVLGIRNKDLGKIETTKRVMRYLAGMAVIDSLFEGMAGMPSPVPNPMKDIYKGLQEGDTAAAITLSAMLESLEFFPVVGAFNFGSQLLGPAAEHIGKLTKMLSGNDMMYKDLLPRAMNGDKKAMLTLADFILTSNGMPGTGQATKYLRGQMKGKGQLQSILGSRPELQFGGGGSGGGGYGGGDLFSDEGGGFDFDSF